MTNDDVYHVASNPESFRPTQWPRFVSCSHVLHTVCSALTVLYPALTVGARRCVSFQSDETESLLVRQRTADALDPPAYCDSDTGLESVTVRPGSAGV